MLKPGMFCTVRIITDSRSNALIIPKKALILETDADDVFAVKEGKVEMVNVELGFVEGDRVEVISGLEEGMQVVTVGHEGLSKTVPACAWWVKGANPERKDPTQGVGAGLPAAPLQGLDPEEHFRIACVS